MVRVLVVDDERDFTDLLSERLRTRGMEVETAYNGQEALDVARTFAPEVVVLDITMPGMSGLETMEALRGEKPAPEVILLTADTTLGTAVAGMKGGARDYLTKPTDIDTLVSAIGEAEGRRMEGMSRQRMAETAKLAALGELATGVAHEINNPLQVVLNEVGWIGEVLDEAALEENSSEQILESLDLIRHQALRCKAITSKLLTLRCALDAKGTKRSLSDLVQDVLDARRPHIERLGVRIEKDWPAHAGDFELLDSEWGQVLGNLVDNALDALESTPAEERLLTIQAGLENLEFTLSVQDSGCGMEEHLLTRIFEPFFSTKEVGKGIGLGLAICHGIIEAMGGNISVRSTPGRGSTFTIKVPMAVHAHNEHNGPEYPASAKEE